MKPLVVAYKPLPDDVTAQSREHVEPVQVDGAEALIEALIKAEGVIGASLKITPQILDHVSRLEMWSMISVGRDNFDVPDLTCQGIVLAYTPDVLTEPTADAVFSLILSSAWRAVGPAEWARVGNWQRSIGPELYGMDVQGRMTGIVGLRRIGAASARRVAHGFRMHVLYTNWHPYPEAEAQYDARRMTLDMLLAEADSICLQVSLAPETQHLIGAAEPAKMKCSAVLINVLRGTVVDEVALIDALRNGTMRGVGFDVFEHGPLPVSSSLLAMNNAVVLSHISSVTREARHAMTRCAADNLIKALVDTLCENLANPQVLEPACAL